MLAFKSEDSSEAAVEASFRAPALAAILPCDYRGYMI
jgi:hypothetical protein